MILYFIWGLASGGVMGAVGAEKGWTLGKTLLIGLGVNIAGSLAMLVLGIR